jgi:hypothetical protein
MALRTSHAALVGVALAAAAVLFAFDPAVTPWFPSCPLFALTGWLCPFCGSLRAFHALVHGHVLDALALNPLTTTGATCGLAALAHDALRPARTGLVPRLLPLCLGPEGLAFTAVFGVLRNMR